MGICGKYIQKFSEANLACCDGIHLDGGYKHVFFNVVEIKDNTVILESQWDGTKFVLSILTNKNTEFAEIEQKGTYEMIFNKKPHKFKILPFKGERFCG